MYSVFKNSHSTICPCTVTRLLIRYFVEREKSTMGGDHHSACNNSQPPPMLLPLLLCYASELNMGGEHITGYMIQEPVGQGVPRPYGQYGAAQTLARAKKTMQNATQCPRWRLETASVPSRLWPTRVSLMPSCAYLPAGQPEMKTQTEHPSNKTPRSLAQTPL